MANVSRGAEERVGVAVSITGSISTFARHRTCFFLPPRQSTPSSPALRCPPLHPVHRHIRLPHVPRTVRASGACPTVSSPRVFTHSMYPVPAPCTSTPTRMHGDSFTSLPQLCSSLITHPRPRSTSSRRRHTLAIPSIERSTPRTALAVLPYRSIARFCPVYPVTANLQCAIVPRRKCTCR
jgi:hypothetical protein